MKTMLKFSPKQALIAKKIALKSQNHSGEAYFVITNNKSLQNKPSVTLGLKFSNLCSDVLFNHGDLNEPDCNDSDFS